MTTSSPTFNTSTAAHALPPVPERPWIQRALPVTGAVYVVAWLAGLLVAPATPGTADAGSVQAFFTVHADAFVLQALLVHGLAGLAVGGLTVGFAVAAGRGRIGRWIAATGLAAAGVSLLRADRPDSTPVHHPPTRSPTHALPAPESSRRDLRHPPRRFHGRAELRAGRAAGGGRLRRNGTARRRLPAPHRPHRGPAARSRTRLLRGRLGYRRFAAAQLAARQAPAARPCAGRAGLAR